MPKNRKEIPELEKMVQTGQKKFVRYAEGAQLYSMGLHTFQELAKEAGAIYRLKRIVLINTEITMKKHMTFFPPGGKKGRRDSTLGEGYRREDIEQRIQLGKGYHTAERPSYISPRLRKAYETNIQKLVSNSMSQLQQYRVNQFYRAGHFLEMSNSFVVNQREVRQNAIQINKLFEECQYLLKNQIQDVDDIDERMKRLREKERELKKEQRRYSEGSFSDLEDDSMEYSAQQERLEIRSELSGIRKEIRLLKRIQAEEETRRVEKEMMIRTKTLQRSNNTKQSCSIERSQKR